MALPIDEPHAAPTKDHSARHVRGREAWDDRLRRAVSLEGPGDGIPETWFLGPQAENIDVLKELVATALDSHAAFRRDFHPDDPTHLTEAVRNSPEFARGIDELRGHTGHLLKMLRLSAPFASMRYQGHMLWDQALPATIGTIAALLYNQNNVAAEASPVTTRLEIEVGNDLCRMLGYDTAGSPAPWGHITSGGTVANIEALWAARNLKFSPVGLKAALREVPQLAPARNVEVPLWDGSRARLVDLDTWTLLNLDLDVVAELPQTLIGMGVAGETLTDLMAGYSARNVGFVNFYAQFMNGVSASPVLLAPATAHYSWPKAATILGLGQNALLVQRVDRDARLDLEHVETTLNALLRRRVPLLAAVAVIGSTEESAVDPLLGLLALRDRFRARGMNFAIHADAAWGGYFRSMLRDAEPPKTPGPDTPPSSGQVPVAAMSAYVEAQYRVLGQADSITVDPHKGGYIPYPAGALCYRNAAWRDAVSLRAPVVFHSQTEPTIGIYGIEGSKPGAAAAAVWLAHKVIRPDRGGYGRILGQCMWTSKRMFCRLATLDDPRFTVTLFNRTPAERVYGDVAAERTLLGSLARLSNGDLSERLTADPEADRLFQEIGSDQVILSFVLNFRDKSGVLNTELARANAFNDRVFSHCSVVEPRENWDGLDLLLTSSRFDPGVYGHHFVNTLCRRMGVAEQADLGIDFLISTTMDPWTTDTDGGDFLAVIEAGLRRAAHLALDELGF